MKNGFELDLFRNYLYEPDPTDIYLTGCKFEGLHKYAATVKYKVCERRQSGAAIHMFKHK